MPPLTTDPTREANDQIEDRRTHPITVHVNERPVELPSHTATGLEIKTAAVTQGVPIETDFILVEELGHGRTKIIGNDDTVHLTEHRRFLANDGDDNA